MAFDPSQIAVIVTAFIDIFRQINTFYVTLITWLFGIFSLTVDSKIIGVATMAVAAFTVWRLFRKVPFILVFVLIILGIAQVFNFLP